MADIEYRFGTGEGDPNVHHGQANVDVDGDGATDAIAVDFDGDGRYDDAMWDSDGDGVADTALLDTDNDGVAESAYSDPSGEGTWNAKGQGGNPEPEAPSAEQPAESKEATPGDDTAPVDAGGAEQPASETEDPDKGDAGAESEDVEVSSTDTEADAGEFENQPAEDTASEFDSEDSGDTHSAETDNTATDDPTEPTIDDEIEDLFTKETEADSAVGDDASDLFDSLQPDETDQALTDWYADLES
ncbi:MAG: hypothetical protein M3548_21065 [Actinomycetota bacterium]|nr:hypothetical protein [Actinomycetota bacterium]